jgi:hypothetical protein
MENEPPINLSDVRAEIEAIKKEGSTLGYALNFDSLREYREAIEKLRLLRQGRPPCYRRMFEPTAPQCRICELEGDCGGNVELQPLAAHELEPVLCPKCQIGRLAVECRDDQGRLADYSCTTVGCDGQVRE